MPTKNLVILMGHAGGDPEMKYSASGSPICNFSLATSWGKKNPDGSWENFTDWHKVVCFGGVAERVAERLQKGALVVVEGTIRYESWDGDDGQKKYMTKIIGNRVDVVGKSGKAEDVPVNASADAPSDEEEDDLPF